MKVLLSFALLAWSVAAVAGSSGSFAGTVVPGPGASEAWIYVQGRNHAVRRVNVRRAKVHYGSDVPQGEHKTPTPSPLPTGTEVRVTAEQDDTGEWQATEVEILRNPSPENEKKPLAPTTSQT